MAVKKRLIACLLWNRGNIVQSIDFRHTNAVGNAFTSVEFFTTWAIDEIVLLDVSRGERELEDREEFYKIVQELSRRCFVPLAVGGFVRTVEEIRTLLSRGADKVVINSGVQDGEFITKAAKMFGDQCIVASIDAKYNEKIGGHEVYLSQGKIGTGVEVVEWAKRAEDLHAGEIFLTSIDNDGGRKGYDLELISKVSQAVEIPVIASGGVGFWDHFSQGIEAGADAVSAANIFHYTEQSTKLAKDAMQKAGIDVRKPEFFEIKTARRPVYKV